MLQLHSQQIKIKLKWFSESLKSIANLKLSVCALKPKLRHTITHADTSNNGLINWFISRYVLKNWHQFIIVNVFKYQTKLHLNCE